MSIQAGGCLCGALRFVAKASPERITVCHCRFCQRATGGAYMVEPLFLQQDISITQGTPTVFDIPSAGSGKLVHVHFCATCGTKVYLTFERFPGWCGVYAGTFDDPDWIEVRPDNSKQIFCDVARPDTVLLPHVPAFGEHAMTNEGTPLQPVVFDQPRIVGRRAAKT